MVLDFGYRGLIGTPGGTRGSSGQCGSSTPGIVPGAVVCGRNAQGGVSIAEVNLCLNLVAPNRFSLPDSGCGHGQNQTICPMGGFLQAGSGTVTSLEARHGSGGEPQLVSAIASN